MAAHATRKRKSMNCAECKSAWREPWGKDITAIHCGAAGEHQGSVTVLFKNGFENYAAQQPIPAWCPRKKEEAAQ